MNDTSEDLGLNNFCQSDFSNLLGEKFYPAGWNVSEEDLQEDDTYLKHLGWWHYDLSVSSGVGKGDGKVIAKYRKDDDLNPVWFGIVLLNNHKQYTFSSAELRGMVSREEIVSKNIDELYAAAYLWYVKQTKDPDGPSVIWHEAHCNIEKQNNKSGERNLQAAIIFSVSMVSLLIYK